MCAASSISRGAPRSPCDRAARRMRRVSRLAARRWLWLAALATMPVPFYLGEVEWAPVMRLAFLTSLLSLVMVAEGGSALIRLCTLGIMQTALYTGLFMLAAGLAARAAAR